MQGGLLDSWTGCDGVNGSDQCLVDMTSARSVTATFVIDPNPPPPDPAPTAKQVDLSANKRRVEASAGGCTSPSGSSRAPGTRASTVLLQGRNRQFTGTLDASCEETFRVRMKRTTTFQATSPQQDADHLAGTSNTVRVRVKQPD